MAENITNRYADPERHRDFDHQLALCLHLAARGPQSQRIAANTGTILIRSFARKVAKSIIHSGEAGVALILIKQLIIQIL